MPNPPSEPSVQPVTPHAPPRPGLKIALGLLALLIGGAAGFLTYNRSHTHAPGQVPLEPIDAAAAQIDVRTLTDLDPGDLAKLLEPTPQIEAFAKLATQGKTDSAAKARAICDALQARKQKRAFIEWSRVEARDGTPLTASETRTAIAVDGRERQLYPLELTALAVASLRSVAVPALVAEIYSYPNERTPLDPSGRLGYHGVVLLGQAGKPARVYDAYGGRTSEPSAADYAVLNDAQAIGAALAIRAQHKLSNALDPKGALEDSAAALKLLPSSPSVHTIRAGVLLTREDGHEQGSQELQTALKLRNDAARHTNLGIRFLAQGDLITATQELKLAVTDYPDYALARLMQATAYLMMQERALSYTTLEQVDKLDPTLGQLPQIWAQWYASGGEKDQALRYAQEAVRRRPRDPQPLFVLARIERTAGHDADVRKHARELLNLVPPEDRERRKSMVLSALGPNVLDDAVPGASWLHDAGSQ